MCAKLSSESGVGNKKGWRVAFVIHYQYYVVEHTDCWIWLLFGIPWRGATGIDDLSASLFDSLDLSKLISNRKMHMRQPPTHSNALRQPQPSN